MDELSTQNIQITPDNLIISDCFLILPVHQFIDKLREEKKDQTELGRGIGPSYEDKVGERGIRICDLFDKEIYLIKFQNYMIFIIYG